MPNIWNGTMFDDLDWPLNASRGLSAIAEFLLNFSKSNSAIAEFLVELYADIQSLPLTSLQSVEWKTYFMIHEEDSAVPQHSLTHARNDRGRERERERERERDSGITMIVNERRRWFWMRSHNDEHGCRWKGLTEQNGKLSARNRSKFAKTEIIRGLSTCTAAAQRLWSSSAVMDSTDPCPNLRPILGASLYRPTDRPSRLVRRRIIKLITTSDYGDWWTHATVPDSFRRCNCLLGATADRCVSLREMASRKAGNENHTQLHYWRI